MSDDNTPDSDPNAEAIPEAEILDESPEESSGTVIPAKDVFPTALPIVPIDLRPLFPKMLAPVLIDDEHLKTLLLKLVENEQKYVGLLLTKGEDGADPDRPPKPDEVHTFGTVAEIVQTNNPEGDQPFQVMLGVIDRFEVTEFLQEEPYLVVKPKYVSEVISGSEEEMKACAVSIINCMKELIQLNPLFKEELNLFMSRSSLNDPGRLADFAAAMTTANGDELQDVLESLEVRKRIEMVMLLLKKEIDISKLQAKINKQIEEKVSKQQRNFFLREQLKEIKKELGLHKEGKDAEIEKFRARLEKLTVPEDAMEVIEEEMDKLNLLDPQSPEFNVSRSYLDWLTILPWGLNSEDSYDITRAHKILDKDHYGLEDVKDRILEFLSVGKLKGKINGSILCFVGPPGVGKTSIGKSIAEAIDREFYRFSVGGMRDEAEIKGHRRTYIGALPGKFLQALKTCKTSNPVLMLDEIDKIGTSFRGDPASALLEVLDPEQNSAFLDHYLDVPFDLSQVLFVCTANQLDTIPRPLLDRMEIIRLSGYIMDEKLQIAKRYLVPKQIEAHGLAKKKVSMGTPVLRAIIDGYAREPGVRNLENLIKKVLRKVAKQAVTSRKRKFELTPDNLKDYLGQPYFEDEMAAKPQVGVIMGLAWTSMGGDTLMIEASPVPSAKGGFKQTGQLGDVMIESSEIAYTYIRSFLKDKKHQDYFNKHAIHLHVPAGATPKDGPSAGITMACALYSLAFNKPIKRRFAMTGELSLVGKVMPIGGVKEKTIAAKRAKATNLIFPMDNKKDYDELPDNVKKGIKPHFVETFEEVISIAF